MGTYPDVCVLIPTLNEAATIGDVVSSFIAEGFERVLVVDGNSTDDTRELAREAGARVIRQSGTGKGAAVRDGLIEIEQDVVLLVDGDGTYRPSDAHRMVEPILDGEVAHVIGNRFADMTPGAMSRLNQFGNRAINTAFALVHGYDLRDILSGYRAFTLDSTRVLNLTAEGFGIETELAVECVKHDVPTTVVPIGYDPRPDMSETNLRPVKDGGAILMTLYSLARATNPMFYFGILSAIFMVVGLSIGGFVGYDWFVNGISHEGLVVVTAFAFIFGLQLLMFGVMSSQLLTLHRDQIRRLEHLVEDAGLERSSSPTDRAESEEDDGEAFTGQS